MSVAASMNLSQPPETASLRNETEEDENRPQEAPPAQGDDSSIVPNITMHHEPGCACSLCREQREQNTLGIMARIESSRWYVSQDSEDEDFEYEDAASAPWLYRHIANGNYNLALERLQTHPHEAAYNSEVIPPWQATEVPNSGHTALHEACAKDAPPRVISALLEASPPWTAFAPESDGDWTPLRYALCHALSEDSVKVVDMLLHQRHRPFHDQEKGFSLEEALQAAASCKDDSANPLQNQTQKLSFLRPCLVRNLLQQVCETYAHQLPLLSNVDVEDTKLEAKKSSKSPKQQASPVSNRYLSVIGRKITLLLRAAVNDPAQSQQHEHPEKNQQQKPPAFTKRKNHEKNSNHATSLLHAALSIRDCPQNLVQFALESNPNQAKILFNGDLPLHTMLKNPTLLKEPPIKPTLPASSSASPYYNATRRYRRTCQLGPKTIEAASTRLRLDDDCDATSALLAMLLAAHDKAAWTVDSQGWLPLHLILSLDVWMIGEWIGGLNVLLKAYPSALYVPVPPAVAAEGEDSGSAKRTKRARTAATEVSTKGVADVDALVQGCLWRRDTLEGLYPFMLAAATDRSLSLIYRLLRKGPEMERFLQGSCCHGRKGKSGNAC